MELEKAENIVRIWGIFLEHSFGKLNLLFMAKIPDFFLPFPKETIEVAVNTIAEMHHNAGNTEAVNSLQSTLPYLIGFIDNEQAIINAAKLFKDDKYRDKILPALKRNQDNWINI